MRKKKSKKQKYPESCLVFLLAYLLEASKHLRNVPWSHSTNLLEIRSCSTRQILYRFGRRRCRFEIRIVGSPLNSMNRPNVNGLDLLVGPFELALGSFGQESLGIDDTVNGRIPFQQGRNPRSTPRMLLLLHVPCVNRGRRNVQSKLVPTQGQILLLGFLSIGKDSNHRNSLLQSGWNLDAFEGPLELGFVGFWSSSHCGWTTGIPNERSTRGWREGLMSTRRIGASHKTWFHDCYCRICFFDDARLMLYSFAKLGDQVLSK